MKKFLTTIVAVMMLIVCSLSFVGCGARDLDEIIESGKITVATNAEFAPFESKEGENYVGIDMDIAREIAKELGVELEIKNMEFDSVITAVQKGQCDLALAGLTINETRRQAINFSSAYFGAAQYLIVTATDTTFDACTTKEQVEAKIATLSGKATAQVGTTGYFYIIGNADFGFNGFANITGVSLDAAVNAAAEVENDRALFAVVDDEVAKNLVANNANLKVVDVALSSEEYGIGVNKKSTKLLEKVNAILADLIESGRLAEIIATHTA